MLSSDDFKALSKDYVFLAHVTTRIEGRKDDDLLGKKGGRGFPYVVAMNSAGHVTASLQQRNVDGFKTMMTDGADYEAKKANPELPLADQAELLKFDLSVGNIDLPAAEETFSSMKELGASLKDELTAMIKAKKDAIFDERFSEFMPKSRDKEAFAAAGKKFLEMWNEKIVPKGQMTKVNFYYLIMEYADGEKNLEVLKKTVDTMDAEFGSDARLGRLMTMAKDKLAKLEAEMKEAHDSDGEGHEGGADGDGKEHDGDDSDEM